MLLTTKEAADKLSLSKQSVYRLIRQRELPAIRIGDRDRASLRVESATLDQWL